MNTKNDVNTIAATDVINQANKLFEQREYFETVTLARTNEALYQLLADVYALYKNTVKDVNCMKESVASMRKEMKERGIVTQANTRHLTVFVRYIFNCDRKRSYNYTQTLLAAIAAKIEPEGLPDFIIRNSGVEEIKRARTVKPEAVRLKQDIEKTLPTVKAELESMSPIASVTMPGSSFDLNDDTKYAFIVARIGVNGELELLKTVPKTTVALENIAFKALAVQAIEHEAENIVVVKGQLEDIAIKTASDSLVKAEPVAA
jgi:hypothetical protein